MFNEEQLIEKYGEDVIKHPREFWSKKREADYLEQVELLKLKEANSYREKEVYEIGNILVKGKILKDIPSECSCCSKYKLFFNVEDDINIFLHRQCKECYVRSTEGSLKDD